MLPPTVPPDWVRFAVMSYRKVQLTPSSPNWYSIPFPLPELPTHCPATVVPCVPPPEPPPGPLPLPEPPDPPLPDPPPPPPAAATATSAPAAASPPTMATVGSPPPPAAPLADVLPAVEVLAEAPGAAPVLDTTTPSELKPASSALLSSTLA